MQILNEQKVYLILTLDELDALIHNEGSDALYNLTRVQEDYMLAAQRLSLIGVVREASSLETLDASTRSTMQRNIIRLEGYSKPQLCDILIDRISYAFHENMVPEQTIDLAAESAALEGGDARYAIELLWRAGKYADAEGAREVSPEHVRKASASVYPSVSKDTVLSLGLHEKLFLLAIARHFRLSGAAYLSMGEAESAYAVVCEEYGQERRGHTQLWKYVRELAALDIVKAVASSVGQRGKTTMLSLPRVPATELEKEISKTLGK
jgi:cell division control protein 6